MVEPTLDAREGRYMTGETVSLHHRIEGPEDAPVLVLANSLGTTLEMWDPQAPALRERFRLVRYDHRGQGASPVPPAPTGWTTSGATCSR
nr:alpha/beta fold hydrolase [Rubrobacter marinus]